MLIPLSKLCTNYRLLFKTIVHVGADTGQELAAYAAAGAERILWIEPRRDAMAQLQKHCKQYPSIHHSFANVAIGQNPGFKTMHIASNGEASSLLTPKVHLQMHQHISFSETRQVEVATLNHAIDNAGFRHIPIDLLNLDTQGTELNVLRSGSLVLPLVQSVYSEVNITELYSGCSRLPALSSWLASLGFTQLDTEMTHYGWGDAFFLRLSK